MAFPRPGRALKTILFSIGAFGILQAILVNYAGAADLFLNLVCIPEKVLHGEVWRLVTAGFLTSPDALGHLIFTLIGLYFLSPDLERRWGAARFVRFLLLSVVAGFSLSILLDKVMPAGVPAFHPRGMFGAGAAIAAVAVAWSKMNADLQVRLFFFLPVSGRQLFWLTIGFCVLGVIYPAGSPEGVFSPFGGVLVGVLLGGTPSVLRSLYLRIKLALLRRSSGNAAIQPLLKAPPRRRPGSPPLRVVSGGLEDELKKRRPPKDKRFLN
ncbi:MAG: rhomboid family intramembrane serine protease [Polyangiaceae bacterium]